MMKSALIGGIIEISESLAEIGIQEDIPEFKACAGIHTQVHCLIAAGSLAYGHGIGFGSIFIGTPGQGLAGDLAVVKEADSWAGTDKKVVFMTGNCVLMGGTCMLIVAGREGELIGEVEWYIDIAQVQGLFGIDCIGLYAGSGIIILIVLASLGGIGDGWLEKEPFVTKRDFNDGS